jgi:hypothetical protein
VNNEYTKFWEGELTDYWMDNGILYGTSRQNTRTIEKLKKDFELVRQITDNKKVCFILDNTNSIGYDINTLKYSLKEIPQTYKAIAFVSRSSTGKMVSEIFSQLYSTETLPVQIFDNHDAANEWIKQINGGPGYTF